VGDRLKEIVESCVAKGSAHLIDYGVRGERGTRVIEVVVDTETGVTTDTCSGLSREIIAVIDKEGVLQGGYRLEVSSPGIERPLRFAWQYRKHMGREFMLSVRNEQGSEKQTGRLSGIDDGGIVLQSGKKEEPRRISFDAIIEARVLPPW